jgi:hypothetical protein
MTERLYCVKLPDGRTFRCVESDVAKNGWKCPITKKKVDPTTLQVVE